MKTPEPSPPEAHKSTQAEAEPAAAHLRIRVNLPHGGRVRIKVAPGKERPGAQPVVRVEQVSGRWERQALRGRLLATLKGRLPAGAWFFAGALLVYLAVRLVGLSDFPIYFFTDEAIQTMSAVDLLHNSLRGPDGTFLPTYFQNGPYYNLGISVYLQVLPTLVFGKSVFVTRAVSVLVSGLAAFSIGMILKNYVKLRSWWLGVLLLSVTPAWFLHSRTAFETVIFTSLYAVFLYAYLLYRCTSPRYLYLALVAAGLAFYAYSPGQLVIVASGVLLFFSDLPYHWQQRQRWANAGLVAAALALPYVRFRLGNPFDPEQHLRLLNSYWIQDLSLPEKLARFWAEYRHGLSLRYWFSPQQQDLARHVMLGYGNISPAVLPFFLIGVAVALSRVREAVQRAILIAMLCAPLGSALVGIGITRVLVFVVPAALLSGLGLSTSLDWLADRWRSWRPSGVVSPERVQAWLAAGMFGILVVANFWMLADALQRGPVWFSDYGLGGMQYGAQQLFPVVDAYRREHPQSQLIVTPNWANGTDVLARFFLEDEERISLGSVDGHLFEQKPLDEKTVFVMLADELQRATASGKFTDLRVEQTIPYPDGQDGFYFVRMRYVDTIAEILEKERAERRVLQKTELEIAGQAVELGYSMLDMGTPELLFDGDVNSVARTLEANPMVLDLWFEQARPLQGISVFVGRTAIQMSATLYFAAQAPLEFQASQREADDRPELALDFGQEYTVERLRLEIAYPERGEPEHVHVWEVTLR